MIRIMATIILLTFSVGTRAQNPPPTPNPHPLTELRVIAFAGGFNLPIWAAERQGYFAREGLDVRLSFTPNSIYQMTNLLAGNYDLAMTAIDNVVAYDEGQGEAPIGPDPQLVAVLGSDDAFLSLVAQDDVRKVADLRGKTVTVDAVTTGFAFVLFDLLSRAGVAEDQVRLVRAGGVFDRFLDMVRDRQHAATMQMTPFDLLSDQKGMHVLERVRDVIGPYQGIVAAVRRPWAAAHAREVVGFIRAYKQAIEWLYDPANRPVAEAILVAHIASMTFPLARATCDIMLAPTGGFYRNVAPDVAGIRTVLALRSKYGSPQRELTDPMRYVDLAYLHQATGAAPQ